MRSHSPRSTRDRALTWTAAAFATCAGAILLLIVAFVAIESLPALRQLGIAPFLSSDDWAPSDDRYGLLPLLTASAAVTAGAVAVALPLGLGSALFRRFYAPPLVARWFRRMIELLAGVPSVVFGLWGLVNVVPLVAAVEPPGASLLAGTLVLALMILPTIALTADAALDAVPAQHLRGAAALGLGRVTTIARIALPAARGGIAAGVILATGRAIGETMAVLMVCGNVVQFPTSPFTPVRTVTANIALEMGYATAEHRSVLFVSGLALIVSIVLLVSLSGWTARRFTGA